MARGTVQQFKIATQATLKDTRTVLINTAKREHNRVLQADPQPRSFTRRVDGQLGAREEDVSANGVIVYKYPRVVEVVEAAMDTLFSLSPVLKDEYRRQHTIFVDNQPVSDLKTLDGASDVVIANFVPYSRKIELGKMRMRVPGTDHVYEQAAFLLNRRFGNLAVIEFSYRPIIGGSIWMGRSAGSDNRYPALIISER